MVVLGASSTGSGFAGAGQGGGDTADSGGWAQQAARLRDRARMPVLRCGGCLFQRRGNGAELEGGGGDTGRRWRRLRRYGAPADEVSAQGPSASRPAQAELDVCP